MQSLGVMAGGSPLIWVGFRPSLDPFTFVLVCLMSWFSKLSWMLISFPERILGFSPFPKEKILVRVCVCISVCVCINMFVCINVYVCTSVLLNDCKIHRPVSTELGLEVCEMKSFVATDT